jgi:AraC-like DNA-binding protein
LLLCGYVFSQGMSKPKGWKFDARPVVDYEIELITESEGSQVIDGRHYAVERHDIVVRKPGSWTQGIMPYSCLTLIFDAQGRPKSRPAVYWQAWTDPEGTWEPQDLCGLDFLDAGPPVRPCDSPELYEGLFMSAIGLDARGGEAACLLAKSLLLKIFYSLQIAADPPAPAGEAGARAWEHSRSTLLLALRYMSERFREPLKIGDVARAAGLSRSRFHQLFAEAFGMSPQERLIAIRLEAARELLAATANKIDDIGCSCGFGSPSNFYTLFKKAQGMTPAEFRSMHRVE